MTKFQARDIAEKITNDQLLEMFQSAMRNITDWTEISKVNKSISKGTAWNILAKDFDIRHNYSIMAKKNMVREFGDFLPIELKINKKVKVKPKACIHQEPNFGIINYK